MTSAQTAQDGALGVSLRKYDWGMIWVRIFFGIFFFPVLFF